ncbi:uncharacterized protein PFL1_00680 [Pseudozyma flocculosa PF-1]|uniref:Glutamine synthetase n=1 Tax=Pseudozyma flocculosa TaxID=84751 RepID=A0A5C3F5D0_9BASI|nr:uncharacterized protein PFL1_00680 [Pseudozyma flocculosa PF-1]EPQ31345.1 hypothetical protein PFL1_00680 [Pseudozyma flocculosa PF-1]SPO38877.1 probable glutamine synthetase [Pseudozyma flocculosa]
MTPPTTKPTSYDELAELLKDDNKVKVAGVDIDGVLRGKYMSKKKFLSAAKPGSDFGFANVIFGWDIHDAMYTEEVSIANKSGGYNDLAAVIDLSTYRRLPWENDMPFFLVSFNDPKTGRAMHACPRNLLKGVTDRIRGETGWDCMAGAEFEYFQYAETPQSLVAKGYDKLAALTPGNHGYSMLRTTMNKDYFLELFDAAEEFGIEIEGHHTETGPGVYETALAYTEACKMADSAVLYKLLAKSVGIKYGIIPTFMAKPYAQLSGCSGHMHVSLRDPKTGRNVFALSDDDIKAGGRKDAQYDDVRYLSQEGEHFLAGIMTGLPDIMPLLCPTINSYKRLQGGEAFWAPNICSYGFDSRLASVRILGPPDLPSYATRFEVRVPGADVNAPLAFSALFSLGLYGIQHRLALPFAPMTQCKEADRVLLPTSLDSATARFEARDSWARKTLGNDFVDHFAATRRHEVALWNRAVTNWELERYLELV